jgi:hypothetical protein
LKNQNAVHFARTWATSNQVDEQAQSIWAHFHAAKAAQKPRFPLL